MTVEEVVNLFPDDTFIATQFEDKDYIGFSGKVRQFRWYGRYAEVTRIDPPVREGSAIIIRCK